MGSPIVNIHHSYLFEQAAAVDQMQAPSRSFRRTGIVDAKVILVLITRWMTMASTQFFLIVYTLPS